LDAVREGFDTAILIDLTAAVTPSHVPKITEELAAVGVVIKESAGGLSQAS
jgi:hypothetical protein